MARFLIPALFAVAALPAAAQDGATGLAFSGEAKLEYVDATSHLWAFRGDLVASWRSGGLLGFDASVDTVYLDDGDNFTNFWGALVLSMGDGELAVGAPRPMVDTLRVMPRFSTSRALDLETSFMTGAVTTLQSAGDNGITPGVTYKYASGNLTFGAGYHHLNDGASVDLAEGIMRFDGGSTSYFISAEYADAPGDNLLLMQIGGLYDGGQLDAGVTLAKMKASDTTHTLRLYGSYDVMSALTVRGDMLMIQDAKDIYSLSATYDLESGLYVEGGGSVVNGSDKVYDIGVGFKF